MPKHRFDIIKRLSKDVQIDAGDVIDDNINNIDDNFQNILSKAMDNFKTSVFDNDGFINKVSELKLDQSDGSIKDILNSSNLMGMASGIGNNSELLLRRDIANICKQMPEMHEAVYLMRDSIIECNIATGEVSRSITFGGTENDSDGSLNSEIKKIERDFDLMNSIKNHIIPQTLMYGEMYVHVVPYYKIFAKLDKQRSVDGYNESTQFESTNICENSNIDYIVNNTKDLFKISEKSELGEYTSHIYAMMSDIEIMNDMSIDTNGMSVSEYYDFLKTDYKSKHPDIKIEPFDNMFYESIDNDGNEVVNDDDSKAFKHIKGCYVRYLDGLKVMPIRIDRKIIGYYYITSSSMINMNGDGATNPMNSSYQKYNTDKNVIGRMADVILGSFDKSFLRKNIKLKNEIVDVLMAHKFGEGKLSFIFIPEDEMVRFSINDDADGKGHSMLEPSIFPARMYMLLNMYNMIYTLNNTTTRVVYLKSSSIDKDYVGAVQRTMRKFQSHRISVDDIFSYNGVVNKVGGIGEIVIPAGKGDHKAIETDTIAPVTNPIDLEFLEQQKRQALSGGSSPNIALINAVNEVDFAKTLQLANSRHLSAVSSNKIDLNNNLTKFYQLLLSYNSDIETSMINSLVFKFNSATQHDMSITNDMIDSFNNICDIVSSVYYNKSEIEDDDGNPTNTSMYLRRELAKEYMSQLDFDKLDTIVANIKIDVTRDELNDRSSKIDISDDDISNIDK